MGRICLWHSHLSGRSFGSEMPEKLVSQHHALPSPFVGPCLISWEVDERASLGQSCAKAMKAQQGNFGLRSPSQAAGIRPLTLNTSHASVPSASWHGSSEDNSFWTLC